MKGTAYGKIKSALGLPSPEPVVFCMEADLTNFPLPEEYCILGYNAV
jgi:hypothetical protein